MKTLSFFDWVMFTVTSLVIMVTTLAVLGYIPDMGKIKYETKQLDTYLKVKNRQMPK